MEKRFIGHGRCIHDMADVRSFRRVQEGCHFERGDPTKGYWCLVTVSLAFQTSLGVFYHVTEILGLSETSKRKMEQSALDLEMIGQ